VTDEDATSRAQRIADLADLALEQVEATRRAVEELLAEVDRSAAAAAPVVRLEAVPETGLDSARLVAIEMAVAGRTRAEVAAHIRAAYELSDVDALLDDVFGPESGARAGSS
jgi:hypothetical protein